MSNPQRQRGTSFENTVKKYLQAHGHPNADREDFSSPLGDIKGTPATLEAKDRKSISLGTFMVQVCKSDEKTGRGLPCVVVKKRQANIKEAYFVTDLEHGAVLLKAVEVCQEMGLWHDIVRSAGGDPSTEEEDTN